MHAFLKSLEGRFHWFLLIFSRFSLEKALEYLYKSLYSDFFMYDHICITISFKKRPIIIIPYRNFYNFWYFFETKWKTWKNPRTMSKKKATATILLQMSWNWISISTYRSNLRWFNYRAISAYLFKCIFLPNYEKLIKEENNIMVNNG